MSYSAPQLNPGVTEAFGDVRQAQQRLAKEIAAAETAALSKTHDPSSARLLEAAASILDAAAANLRRLREPKR